MFKCGDIVHIREHRPYLFLRGFKGNSHFFTITHIRGGKAKLQYAKQLTVWGRKLGMDGTQRDICWFNFQDLKPVSCIELAKYRIGSEV